MDYLILTVKQKIYVAGKSYDQIVYICANSISRCKNADGKDVIQYVMSGVGQQTLIENVICITPVTPTPNQIEALK